MWSKFYKLLENYILNSNKVIAIETDMNGIIKNCNSGMKILIAGENPISKSVSDYFTISKSNIQKNCSNDFTKIQMIYKNNNQFKLVLYGCKTKSEESYLYIAEEDQVNESSIVERIGEVNLELTNLAREIHKKNKALESKNNIITTLMFQDPLTKLNNRRYLYEKFEKLSSMFRRNAISNITMAIMDIDNFKTVNDTYGHDVGDEVLVIFSDLIKSFSRENDIKIRFGGDEFVLILLNADLETTRKRMEELKRTLENTKIKGINRPITSSIGIVEYKKYEDFQNLLIRADKLLYKAKELGRNTIVTENSEK